MARMNCLITALACAVFMMATPVKVLAEDSGAAHDHSGHTMPPAQENLSEASKELDAITQRMHKDMTVTYTNDIDVDFVRGMIPHHQAAIEHAQVLLKYSKNPRLRRLAGGIIAAQRREIRFMLKWLNERETGKETGDMPAWMRTAPETVEDAKKTGDQD